MTSLPSPLDEPIDLIPADMLDQVVGVATTADTVDVVAELLLWHGRVGVFAEADAIYRRVYEPALGGREAAMGRHPAGKGRVA